MIRQAIIPAAGRGLRLDRPGTPKPLVDVGGVPIIVRLIKQLERYGIQKVNVVTGYGGDKIARGLSAHFGLDSIVSIRECARWEAGLAFSILAARDEVDGDFLLCMADHVFDDELVSLMVNQEPPDGGASALVDRRVGTIFSLESAMKVRLDGSKVRAFGIGLDPFDGVDAGLFASSPALFDSLEKAAAEGEVTGLEDGMQLLAAGGLVNAVEATAGSWDDVDTPADLIHVEMRHRRQQRIQRVASAAGVSSPSRFSEYAFIAGKPMTTRIVVERGLVSDPSRVPLIPEESASSPIFVFTDQTVNRLYTEKFVSALDRLGYRVHAIVLPDGEEAKTLSNYSYLVERVISSGVDERSVFISVGGGVVCNVCGFVASTIYRGLGLVHIPTTMMAQCDAAISHKQAINGARGKNMVGSYYSPLLVAVDVEVLETLSDKLIVDGLAEVIKHALGQDREYAAMLREYSGGFRDLDFLERVVRRNIELKCELAVSDPKELREAMVLQYGHTVGHPIEHLSGYSLYHGESVGLGMIVAARVSRILGACDDELVRIHEELMERYMLPTKVPEGIRVSSLMEALKYNKKYLIEGTRMALLGDVGQLWNVDGDYAIPVSDTVLVEAIQACMEG